MPANSNSRSTSAPGAPPGSRVRSTGKPGIAQRLRQQPSLRGLAGALAAFERDEPTARHLVKRASLPVT